MVALILLVAATPPLLSTPRGTRLLAAAASRCLPGDVVIESIRADWVSPIDIRGVEVREGRRATGSAAASGAAERPAVGAEAAAAEKAPSAATRRGGAKSKKADAADAAAAAAAPEAAVEASAGRLLLAIGRITTAEPMHRVVFGGGGGGAGGGGDGSGGGGGGVTLTIAEPAVDLSLDDAGRGLRLASHLKAARPLAMLLPALRPRPPAPPPTQPAQPPAVLSAQAQQQPSQKQKKQKQQDASQDVAGAADAAAPADAAAADAADDGVTGLPSLLPPGALGALRAALSRADAAAGFSAEVHAPGLQAAVSGGRLLVPSEVREALGRHVHAALAVGADEVRQLAAELGDDAAWVDERRPHGRQSGGGAGAGQQKQARDEQGDDGALGSDDTAYEGRRDQQQRAARGATAERHSRGHNRGRAGALPAALQLDSERLMLDAAAWLDAPRRSLELQRPAAARVELTPAFAHMALGAFNPLLRDVVAVRDGGRVALSVAPASMAAAGGADAAGAAGADAAGAAAHGPLLLRVEPVRLAVAEGPLVAQLSRLLNLGGLFRGAASGSGIGGLLFGGVMGQSQQLQQRRQLEVWTGPMEVEVVPGGACTLRRVDMLLGALLAMSC